jgi:hypothetical protein
VSAPREELRHLVERLSDEQVQAVVPDLKARLTAVEQESPWPPAWFAVAGRSASDASDRVEEILAEGRGQRVGAENPVVSCDLHILVYEAAEPVSS